MNWNVWLQSLLAATLSGAATGATQVISTSGKVNTGTGVAAGIGAVVGLIGFLTHSPLQPPPDPPAPAK